MESFLIAISDRRAVPVATMFVRLTICLTVVSIAASLALAKPKPTSVKGRLSALEARLAALEQPSAPGPTGPMGPTGAAGTSGMPGQTGPTGPTGATGERGERGPKGNPGSAAEVTDTVGGTRLRPQYIVGDDGAHESLGRFLDMLRDEPCSFSPSSTADVRCYPTKIRAYAASVYADAECTEPLAVESYPACEGQYAVEYSLTCPNVPTFYPLGAAFHGSTVYWYEAGGDCDVYPGSYAPRTLFFMGAAIPDTSFVAGTIVVDE